MSHVRRTHSTHRIEIPLGQDTSASIDLREGYHGTIIVPVGSDAIGKTLQIVATDGESLRPGNKTMPDTDMLSPVKTLSVGNNPFTSAEINQISAIGHAKLKLGAAAGANIVIYLLWKS